MTKRYTSKKHLQFVASKPCCMCGSNHTVQAHHLLKPWDGVRGIALKANDKNVIPLCMDHHTQLHKRGNEEAFFEEHGLSNYFGKITARMLWFDSPVNEHYRDCIDEHIMGWADQVLKEEENDSSN